MAVYSRGLLSGSTSGKPIPVVATATLGTTLHIAVAGASSFDEVYIWFTNTSNAAVNLTIEWGAAGVGNHLTDTYSLGPNSAPTPLVVGQVLNGGLVCTAFASVASVINATGFVNHIV